MSLPDYLRRTLILLLLALLILAPPWLVGQSEVHRARWLAASGQEEAAALAYASAARRIFWQPGLWEQAGLLALAGGEPTSALRYFNAARERGALSVQGWIGLGDALYRLAETEQARQAWEQALPDPEAYRRLARLATRQKHFADAMTHWQSVLDQRPDDVEASYRLGLLLVAFQPQQALPYLLHAARLDPGLEESVYALRTSLNRADRDPASWFFQGGLGLASVQEWDLAGEAFHQALALQPDHAEAWAWLGEVLQQQGLDGRQELEQALRLATDSATVQAFYGLYLQRQGEIEQAISAFQTALRLEPGQAAWWAALAGAYEQEGDLITALSYYQKAAALTPRETTYWRALINFCLRHQSYIQDVALPAVRTLLELAPEAWYAHDALGQVLLAMGDLPGAQAALQKALTLAPNQGEIYVHLAMFYLQKGDRSAACNALQRAYTRNPAALSWETQRLREQFCPASQTP